MKGAPPQIELDSLSITDVMSMAKEELMNLPFEKKKWVCGCKGCNRHTHIRDIGMHPVYFGPRFKGFFLDFRQHYYLCGKHYKLLNACERVWGDFVGRNKFNEKYIDYDKAKAQLANGQI